MPEIRRLAADHDEAFTRLWHLANDRRHQELGIEGLRMMLPAPSRPETFSVGAFEDGELVAAALGMAGRADDGRSPRHLPGLAHLSAVATHPEHWGKGLGGTVVRAAMLNAVEKGYARIQLWTHASNRGAQRLYEREAFVRSGREKPDDAGAPILHYLRELPTPRLVLGRQAARVLCLDEHDRLLMMHWHHPLSGQQLWEPPGGGIEAGETARDAVLREWREETGLASPNLVGEPTAVPRDQLWGDARFVGDEVFFVGRYAGGAPEVATALTVGEQTSYLGQEWVGWSDLASGRWRGDAVEPDVAVVLARLAPEGPWAE